MENYYVDGVSICFYDGRVIPLDPSSKIVLHWVAKDYLWGYINANGRVRYGNSKVIPTGDPAYVAAYANQECSYYGQPLPKQSKLDLVVVNDMSYTTQHWYQASKPIKFQPTLVVY